MATGRSRSVQLTELRSMFPETPPGLLDEIYDSMGQDAGRVVDFLLVSPPVDQSKGACQGPSESYVSMVMDFIDLRNIAPLRGVSRRWRSVVNSIYAKQSYVSMTKYRFKPDSDLLALISSFPNADCIDMSRCADFNSFEYIPSSVTRPLGINRLILTGCDCLEDYALSVLCQEFVHIEKLSLAKTYITDASLEFLGYSQSQSRDAKLESLSLNSCESISDYGITMLLTRCTLLRSLDLRKTPITSRIFSGADSPFNHSNLKILNLSSCSKLHVIDLHMPALEILNSSSNPQLRTLTVRCPNLKELNASSSKQLAHVIIDSPRLEELNLSGCGNIVSFRADIPRIKTLNLYNCRQLPSESLLTTFRNSKHCLSILSLNGMIQLSDSDVHTILDAFPHLEQLDVSGCKALTRHSLTRARMLSK